MSRWEKWDESSVRVRPNKKGSRPRTKESPAYSDAELGRVVTVDRGRYTVSLPDRAVSAVRAKALRRTPVVPGDIVGLVGDTSGEEGSLARLVRSKSAAHCCGAAPMTPMMPNASSSPTQISC